ncbi:type VII secretion-associated serine protease mycosin [Candidatus Mycolicibacterium alkanivorans]|uniref:Type VII secretion-associated serine protease mycosin n=1 Tax=Candidatus Mycolicibacterium alkanivorans TaxID=2954114 RepID=A0ABS9YZH3_9MYCO|nr:type VII secretion-associated serine protease mycosin [Candidatus Mycolicibacterium alkanivorans]MCI4676648.1 type VII secretion-associated serine protease mycosin [Candidatus Mycolicibacterium alkanivorans]
MTRIALQFGAVGAVALLISPSAWAVSPPSVDPAAVPPVDSTGPAVPMAQRTECVTTGVIPGTTPGLVSANQQLLNLSEAWRFSRGEGQTVAVIDTGVTPGPRLRNVEPGGDYVSNTDGLSDCDGHGTAAAGIIGGQPGDDGFSGVAPAARLLSIRHTSLAYSPTAPGADPAAFRAAIDIASLARAVVHAADLGARVITISEITCLRADSTLDQQTLGAALRYAAVDKDAVIVAAAGNTGPAVLSGGPECRSNPINPSTEPVDRRNWGGVTSVSVPSWWQPYVLSVGSLAPTGQPSAFTMSGPWLGIAAPGENIVSVGNGPDGGLANGIPGPRGQWTALNGTGYATAYVSGVAALVRSRFPDLLAAQVIQRLQATAHNGPRDPSNLVGAGTVDPVAALTWEVTPVEAGRPADAPARIAAPAAVPRPDHAAGNVAFVGTALLALAVAVAALMARGRKGRQE